MDDDLLIVNGIHAETGRSSLEALTSTELVRSVLRKADPGNLADLRLRRSQDAQSAESLARLQQLLAETEQKLRALPLERSDAATVVALTESLRRMEQEMLLRQHLGVREGIDAQDLHQAGWGVIFAEDADPKIIEALEPLLSLRQAQAGERFRSYSGSRGYRSGGRETKARFLVRNGATAAGPVSPEAVPYYLLIVGGPEKIPFEFQHQLDVQYAVGRLHFETAEEYGRYARTVVAEEQPERAARKPQFALFGVANSGDRATELSSRQLVMPLYELFQQSEPGWEVLRIPPAEASRERLRRLLGQESPALLLTASHGMEFSAGSREQRAFQGALLCQDWPGSGQLGPIAREYFVTAEDIDESAQLRGMVLFLFACYSAGTPERDSFQREQAQLRAPAPFVAALPQRLLSHPAGGALAVIGHIDRAWGYSFAGSGGAQRAHTAAIESTLRRLLHGQRVGYAMEYLNQRYAELATTLSDELGAVRNMRQPDERALAELWTATYDARGYCVLGDPAVRLSSDDTKAKTRE